MIYRKQRGCIPPTIHPCYYGPPIPDKSDYRSQKLDIISFLLPLVGWVLYYYHRKKSPVKAKSCLKWAWIGLVVISLIMVLGVV